MVILDLNNLNNSYTAIESYRDKHQEKREMDHVQPREVDLQRAAILEIATVLILMLIS
jgi:hypothetical protein